MPSLPQVLVAHTPTAPAVHAVAAVLPNLAEASAGPVVVLVYATKEVLVAVPKGGHAPKTRENLLISDSYTSSSYPV